MAAQGSVRIEGGLLSPDFLETITERAGQRPRDFGLEGARTVLDEATAAWGDARNYWLGFQSRLARRSSESPVTVTREQWAIPLLETLGYSLSFQRRAAELDGRRYSISHRAGEEEGGPPVHIVAHDEELGSRNPSRSSQMAPHALLQDYLNRSDHLWGLVTNGFVLRLLRDSTSFTRPTYVEFDLQTMFSAGELDQFLLLYRLAHRTRLPTAVEDAHQCLLERYHQEALEEGGRIREGLRDAVECAILTFGNGFLRHVSNQTLRDQVASGRLRAGKYYQELLYLIYRLLFLMVAEQRNLLQAGESGDEEARAAYERYRAHLSLARLRMLAEQPLSAPERFDDLYLGLQTLFAVLRDPQLCTPLGLAALNGELFEPLPHLDGASLNNRDLLSGLEALSYFVPAGESYRRRVNYAALDVEELGSVYESLLDYQPVIEQTPAGPAFAFAQGTERKSTGSYYTRPELVHELVESALVPVMQARLAATDGSPEARQEALLDLRLCDPACGSGHFLLAAARRIGRELARVRSEEEPSPEVVRVAVRDAITHCLYGVDRNPLAVDLCKVALWIEGCARGRPLTFLDYRICQGDSLVGVFDLEALVDGIPDDAYKPVGGDDKRAARAARDRNRHEREGQLTLAEARDSGIAEVLARRRALLNMPENTTEQVASKREAARSLRRSQAWQRLKGACDLWTAAFFVPLEARKGEVVPTTAAVRRYLATGTAHGPLIGVAGALADRLSFFHWPIEFPEALEQRGGFDVVLGNPPFVNVIEGLIVPSQKKVLRAMYPAIGGTADLAFYFLCRAVELAHSQGRVGMIQPRAMLNSPAMEGFRRSPGHEWKPTMIYAPERADLFSGAAVFVCLLVLGPSSICRASVSAELGRAEWATGSVEHANWWRVLMTLVHGQSVEVPASGRRLSDVFVVTASMTAADAYDIKPYVVDLKEGPGLRLVTTGLIDPMACLWGSQTCRYLKQDYKHPRILAGATVSASLRRRLARASRPKVLVAGLAKRVECFVDEKGDTMGAVSTYTVLHPQDDVEKLRSLCEYLNTDAVSRLLQLELGANALGGGSITIKRSFLEALLLPSCLT